MSDAEDVQSNGMMPPTAMRAKVQTGFPLAFGTEATNCLYTRMVATSGLTFPKMENTRDGRK